MIRLFIVVFALALLSVYDLSDGPLAYSVQAQIFGVPSGRAITSVGVCNEHVPVAAVLRNEGAGWYAINDGTHTPLNVSSVETTMQGITVRFSGKGRMIRTFIVSPDEALSRSGILGGASVGLDKAYIELSRVGVFGPRHVSPMAISTDTYPWSNLWIFGMVDIECPEKAAS
ncbi:MAG: hypothetical protein AB7E81_22955 [Hyphomicrobiaceae bacterium]